MAAPAAQTRTAPAGLRLERGGRGVVVGFELDPDVSIWEIGVTPIGLDVGEMINTTTQWNYWETKAFQTIKMLTAGAIECGFDPDAYNNIITNLLGKNGQVSVYCFDGSTINFWGGIKSFKPTGMVKENMPTATIELEATNKDNSGVERGPVIVAVAGT